MPGLAVIISPEPHAQHERDLNRMVASMQHEAFYTTGTYHNSGLGLHVGWVVHAGSFSDCLPARSDDGNLLLFFYGEHLSEHLNGVKHDARVVLRMFEQHGMDTLPKLNGWFHGVLVDVARGEITVFNDRYGMQRLHCHSSGEATLFASEAKALLAARPELRSIDPRSLGEFLSCGCVLEQRSLFRGVTTVPAATARHFARGRIDKEARYFSAREWESQSPLEARDFQFQVHADLGRAVRRCVESDLPVGVSLTGGFDTRLIMASLNGRAAKLPCYTFGGMYRDCFDVKIARKVAALCDCTHEVLPLDEDFLRAFPALAQKTVYVSDGCLGATNAYELHLNQMARQLATVRLTGSYGSEVMRGSRAFKALSPTSGLLHSDFIPHVHEAAQTFEAINAGHPISFSVFKQAPLFYFNRLAAEQTQVIVRTPFMDNDFVGLFYRKPATLEDGRAFARRLIAQDSEALAALPTDTGNCSFLRYHWSQFLFKADYCYKSGMPQWLERIHHRLGPLSMEKLLIGRHRFAHFRVWFREQLASYVREMLLDARTARRPFFNHRFVEQMVQRHVAGERNFTDDIERVLTVELACRQFIDA